MQRTGVQTGVTVAGCGRPPCAPARPARRPHGGRVVVRGGRSGLAGVRGERVPVDDLPLEGVPVASAEKPTDMPLACVDRQDSGLAHQPETSA
ncbi:MAG: hypothetical protein JWQ95_6296 [Sphaerisporangium sp.]|nr:hypothetical protein [Sphaerisporangium sp.]